MFTKHICMFLENKAAVPVDTTVRLKHFIIQQTHKYVIRRYN